MKTQMISFEGMALETLAEAANDAGEQVEKHAKSAVTIAITAGRALLAAKSQVPHGEWLEWLGKNWNYSRPTASRYMTVAANFSSTNNLTDAKDINEALRMIADSKQETETPNVPRSERKTGRVEVVTPEPDELGQQSVQPDENAVQPEPKTNTKHSVATSKAKEVDKPKTAAVTPEILPDEPEDLPGEKTLADWCEHEILAFLVSSADDAKRRAKALRKAADQLDPPTKFSPPTVEDVADYCHEQGYTAVDAEDFVAYYGSQGWKKSNGQKLTDWRGATRTFNNNQKGGKNGNGKQSAAQAREQANADAFAQLRLASGQ